MLVWQAVCWAAIEIGPAVFQQLLPEALSLVSGVYVHTAQHNNVRLGTEAHDADEAACQPCDKRDVGFGYPAAISYLGIKCAYLGDYVAWCSRNR